MNGLRNWRADKSQPDFPKNLALMLNRNAERLGDRPICQEMKNGEYLPLGWKTFQQAVACLQNALANRGLGIGDRVAILSPNRLEMLELEFAIMAMGAIAVPIFAGYPADQAQALVEFCEPRFVAVADTDQFLKLRLPSAYRLVIHFDRLECAAGPNAASLSDLFDTSPVPGTILDERVATDSVCLMMYTSGTMGKPKCVQLTHGNILSQQAAMKTVWQMDHTDRFLSYLPWHHSFGGIFEKYAALCNGAVLSLEHGQGKNIDTLLMNWRRVKPTVFFSVPRIYQQIVTQVLQNPGLEKEVFHDGLRFIFTAAAPLSKNTSDIFENRGIPIYEGWGLTETSPCCTVSDPSVPREPGVVGKPIPGVALKLAEDGEIFVNGPNVMKGYFRNPEATSEVLMEDGWFATGDIGEFTTTGLRLISRKDRLFKLSNAEKVVPTEVENLILQNCCFLSHAYVTGNGKEYPVVLLFPNKAMFSRKPDESRLKLGCICPAGLNDLAQCLTHCLKELNQGIDAKYMRPQAAMLIDHELSIENKELTPSMKLAPNVVARIFKAHIEQLYGELDWNRSGEVYILNLKP